MDVDHPLVSIPTEEEVDSTGVSSFLLLELSFFSLEEALEEEVSAEVGVEELIGAEELVEVSLHPIKERAINGKMTRLCFFMIKFTSNILMKV